MSTVNLSLSREEIARRGFEIYRTQIEPTLSSLAEGKFVAIDVLSGDYELDRNDCAAGTRLRERHPDACIWMERVGQPAAYRGRRPR